MVTADPHYLWNRVYSSWWLEVYGWRPWILTLIPTSSPILGRLKPIFHWILGLSWLPNANEMDTNNMKSTWPMREFLRWGPNEPIFRLLAWGVGVGGKTNFSVCVGSNAIFSTFGYQHVAISNAKLWRWGS